MLGSDGDRWGTVAPSFNVHNGGKPQLGLDPLSTAGNYVKIDGDRWEAERGGAMGERWGTAGDRWAGIRR